MHRWGSEISTKSVLKSFTSRGKWREVLEWLSQCFRPLNFAYQKNGLLKVGARLRESKCLLLSHLRVFCYLCTKRVVGKRPETACNCKVVWGKKSDAKSFAQFRYKQICNRPKKSIATSETQRVVYPLQLDRRVIFLCSLSDFSVIKMTAATHWNWRDRVLTPFLYFKFE